MSKLAPGPSEFQPADPVYIKKLLVRHSPSQRKGWEEAITVSFCKPARSIISRANLQQVAIQQCIVQSSKNGAHCPRVSVAPGAGHPLLHSLKRTQLLTVL